MSSSPSVSSTGFVEDLAQLWEEAKSDPEVNALLDEQITVVGVGKDKLRFLFKRVARSMVGGKNQIWHGGARLKRYGQGFALTFIDPTEDGKKLSTYVSAAEIADYRYRGMLLDVLQQAHDRTYVTAYIWGDITADERNEERASLKPANLKHLYIVLPLQPTAASAEATTAI
ncbi:hypothetical protein [Roseateles flavus]|uniref:Uncharacterized protein n=1 Tax=Roseateles flavus TaxID=3149041 RepID=A0ABV0GLE4_9BURK